MHESVVVPEGQSKTEDGIMQNVQAAPHLHLVYDWVLFGLP